jgi:hypothetical protein
MYARLGGRMELTMDFLTQAIGIVGMTFGILSYLNKNQRGIMIFQLLATAFFAVHFLMLDAITGCLLNVLGVVRAAVYSQRSTRRWAAHPVWIYIFSAAAFAIYVLSFTVFGKEPSVWVLILELLPVIATAVTSVSYRMPGGAQVRLLSLFSSPLWLIYNACNGSIGGSVSDSLSIISIFVGMYKHDRKGKAEKK